MKWGGGADLQERKGILRARNSFKEKKTLPSKKIRFTATTKKKKQRGGGRKKCWGPYICFKRIAGGERTTWQEPGVTQYLARKEKRIRNGKTSKKGGKQMPGSFYRDTPSEGKPNILGRVRGKVCLLGGGVEC